MARLNPQKGRVCVCKESYLRSIAGSRYLPDDPCREKKAAAYIEIIMHKPCRACGEVFYFERYWPVENTVIGDEKLTNDPAKWLLADYHKPRRKFSLNGSSKLKRPADVNIKYINELEAAQTMLHWSVKDALAKQMMSFA